MNKFLTIIGARPQFIKATALTRALASRPDLGWTQEIIHTGQHFDAALSEVFFEELDLPDPTYNLELKSHSRPSRMGEMMEGIAQAIKESKPDAVLVYGDTDSTLAGALIASTEGVPIVHIESGLRSFDRAMPEEVNRILTDNISAVLVCSTKTSILNLKNEGVKDHSHSRVGPATSISPTVFLSGDIMHDNAMHFLNKITIEPSKNVLFTLHRPSNVDSIERLMNWMDALGDWCSSKNITASFPVHPRTEKSLISAYGNDWVASLKSKCINAISPVGYLELLNLMKSSSLVLTDSGGVQKEAYSCQTPSVVLRHQTEWVELIENGHAFLAKEPVDLAFSANKMYGIKVDSSDELYGSGEAAETILLKIVESL